MEGKRVKGFLGLSMSPGRAGLLKATSFRRPSASSPQKPAKTLGPLFTSWPGRNRFFCGGRVMLGPRLDVFLSAFIAAFIIDLLFLAVLYVNRLTVVGCMFLGALARCPRFGTRISVWLTPIASVLSVSTFVFWLVTAATEPGIIPRNKDGVEPDMPLPDPETGIPWERCDICNVYRPPRAVHCRDCDNCVSRFDHHCAWIGNCVGLRNYKAFIALLWSGTLLGALVFAMSCYRVAVRIMGAGAAESPEYGAFTIIDGFWDGLLSWAFFVVSLVLTAAIGFLCVTHMYLIGTGETSREWRHRRRLRQPSPYDVTLPTACMSCLVLMFDNSPRSLLPDLTETPPKSSDVCVTTTPAFDVPCGATAVSLQYTCDNPSYGAEKSPPTASVSRKKPGRSRLAPAPLHPRALPSFPPDSYQRMHLSAKFAALSSVEE